MRSDMPAPLIRIPPFPGARALTFARAMPERRNLASDAEIDAQVELIVRERVGGTYWGMQPDLPDADYILIAVQDGRTRTEVIDNLSARGNIVQWNRDTACDPWHLLRGATLVVADADNEILLIATIAGVPITCIGEGPFSTLETKLSRKASLRKFARSHIVGFDYSDPFTGETIDVCHAISISASWRRLIDGNRDLRASFGIARWKRRTVAPLLWAGSGTSTSSGTSAARVASGDRVAVWRSRVATGTLSLLEARGARLAEVEDGFIRSAGLGADCVPPQSIVLDHLGIYFDPSRPSSLERLLEETVFTPELIDRAKRLRDHIVAEGISKYESGGAPSEARRWGRRQILVPGQVEDDRAVLLGGQGLVSNLELLKRVRAEMPDGHILYKPHPDVEAGHRVGIVCDEECQAFADEIVRGSPMSQLIDRADEVHVNTSLAGFEALLRGKSVTTYGVPFYAGWGLTCDRGDVPCRRTARRSIDELVAAALILYPRYLDPKTGLPCPPEVLVRRLSEGASGQPVETLVWLRRVQGRINRHLARISR